MNDQKKPLRGPDFSLGVELSTIPDGGMLLGHSCGEPVLLICRGHELIAIGAICTHYGAPLAEGLLTDEAIRCPWHHACFSLRIGEALRASALNPITVWRVEAVRDVAHQLEEQPVSAVFREKLGLTAPPQMPAAAGRSGLIVTVGGRAAGNAAAETRRNKGNSGGITMLSADGSLPCDRPNLSQGYLAGTASNASNLLRSASFYREHNIDVQPGARVTTINIRSGHVALAEAPHTRITPAFSRPAPTRSVLRTLQANFPACAHSPIVAL